MKRPFVGFGLALVAVFCWGVMFPVGRALMERRVMEPSVLAMTRFLLASPLLLGLSWALCRKRVFPSRKSDWIWLAVLGLVGSAMMAVLLFVAQQTIPSLNSSLMEAYVPIQVLLLGILLGKPPTRKELASVGLGFVGVLLILRVLDGRGFQLGTLSQGDLLIFLSGLCWSIYTVLARPLVARMGGLPFSAWTVLFGGIWLGFYNLAMGLSFRMPTTDADWGRVAFLAFCPTALAFFAWNEAQKTISLAHLSFMEYFTPLIAALLGLFFLGESVTLWQWIGIATVILSARLQH